MRLDESRWIYAGGLTPEWRWTSGRRLADALARLKSVAKDFPRLAPDGVRRRRYLAALRYVLAKPGPERDRLLLHPAVDYWLALWDKHFGAPCGESDWHLQMGLFSGLAASLALSRKDKAEFDAVLDPDGGLHLYGSGLSLLWPASEAQKPVRVRVAGGKVSASGDGASLPEARLVRNPEVAPGLEVDDRGWLLMHGVTVHGRAKLEEPGKERFVAVLRQALADMAVQAPELCAEMTDLVRVLVPLENPESMGSVSSSYVNMRGAICLSHAEDPLLQAETLIHEFCHQKLNQLMVVEPVLLPGQAGQVFYSPWRKDPRRLRGLILGAHAFLNVARYLLAAVSRGSQRSKESVDVMVNIALRVFQVESALRTVSLYGTLTPFGQRFVKGMWEETAALHHGVQWFPSALLHEARETAAKHRLAHALGDTGLHKAPSFVDAVERAPFLSPGGTAAPAAEAAA